jgi:AcrR family transcriptional regulator
MKQTFDRLAADKKRRIFEACIREFGDKGYESSSTDRIIQLAGISKGGLYEYISSKKELFFSTVEYTYSELYGYLKKRIQKDAVILPSDILERFRIISSLAIDFYIEHPQYVQLIVRTHQLSDVELEQHVKNTFHKSFMEIFSSIDTDNVVFERKKVFDVLIWFLLKTRYDFLQEIRTLRSVEDVKKEYMEAWDFYLSILKNGIYEKDEE